MQPPSPSEMAVLKTLWSEGALSAREVQARLGGPQDWSYSTTRTLITRMVEKGLVSKRDSHGLAVFAPALSKAAMVPVVPAVPTLPELRSPRFSPLRR